jgi:chromosomal replication initiator protein
VVGPSNRFAHGAAIAVTNNPGQVYNPLFIYGPPGIGKTHLLYAIANGIRKKNPNAKIVFIKGDEFTTELITAIRDGKNIEFRSKYREADLFLIDDIQFIAGKISTQEEFFHTFNALYDEKKQIILTSDRPPRDIKTLEDRLKSRFEWGLIADIEPPDLELRIAIIKKKAEQIHVVIPDDVLTFLGENLRSNIRQIEGAIKKLAALTFISGKVITMDVARECIAELLEGAEPVSITVDKIFAAVYRKYNIPKEDLISTKRTRDIKNVRHITIYLIRELTEMSYPNIGKIFERDHSTIISSYNSVYQKAQFDSVFAVDMNELKKEILG